MLPYVGERDSGRILTTRHLLGTTAVTTAVVYGYPRGPTWPSPPTLTAKLKNSTERDLIWLSPEAIAACRMVVDAEIFSELWIGHPSDLPSSIGLATTLTDSVGTC